MKFKPRMKFKPPRYWPILLLAVAALIAGWQLLRVGYFPMHDDLQVMRFYQMKRCFNDGQIPCRWSPDMGNNYGQPMFNFYSAFPYYLGTFFTLLGVSFIDTVKIVFLLSLFFSGLFTYLFARRYLAVPAAVLAGIAYIFAPYHALDIFVRGALAESWGLVFVPAVFWAISRLIHKPTPTAAIALSLTTFGLFTTHSLTILMSAPFLFLFTIFSFLYSGFTVKKLLYLLSGGLLGIGLSSFFLLPVLFEQNLTQGGQFLTADYFNFRVHFTNLRQLFLITTWEYGPSKFGPDDDISFFVGVVHIFALVAAPFVLIKTFLTKDKKPFYFILFFFLLSFIAIFMTHGKSDPIWTIVPKLAFIQFPWRFLGLAILGTSILAGVLIHQLPSRLQGYFLLLGFGLLVLFNFNYFRFEKWFYWITDEQKLSGELYNLQVRAAVLDYLPVGAGIPQQKAPANPEIVSGDVFINYFDKRSNYFSSEVDVEKTPDVIRFPVVDFPVWKVYLDRGQTPITIDTNNELKQITVTVPPGHHLIQAFFTNTPIRTLANSLTLLSFFTLIAWVLLIYEKKST